MLDPVYSQLLLPLIIALFLAINMGASGTAPSFSAAYGANLIPRSLIAGLFGIMVFIGAITIGKNVAITLGKGIIPSEFLTITLTSIILFSVALSLLFSNLIGIPQSTSQTTIFALSGAAMYHHALKTDILFFSIVPTWFILPVIAFIITYAVGKFIYTPMKKRSMFQFETIKDYNSMQALVIISSLYVSFAIGTNNVANASGPIASMIINELGISQNSENFKLIVILTTLIFAPAFGIGSSLLGRKVMHTSGKEIVEFGPLSAVAISFITATLLLTVSIVKGIPSSLVQLNMGAILAIGCAKYGWREIFRKKSVKKFWVIWIIAPIFAFFLTIFLAWIADLGGILHH